MTSASDVATAAEAELVRDAPGAPARVVIDSREVGSGDLFVALPGTRVDGGEYAAAALGAGAWGVLVAPERVAGLPDGGAVLSAADPLRALGALGRSRRRALGARVIAVTGSVGKTSTKELIAAMLGSQRRVFASRANFNTYIGMPLEILAAPEDTEVLVLEAAMRGFGQIADLAAIAEPDVGVVVNVGPVHLELLGSIEAIAATKAELLAGLRPGGTAVVPAGEALLEPYRTREDVSWVTFGPGGDVDALPAGLELPFTSAHMRANALAALAAARAIGVEPTGRLEVALSELRGQRVELPGGVTVVNDCYNANPMSMRAALDDLAASASGRRVAVLGDMLELGPDERRFHEEIGAHARAAGVDLLVTVGPRAAAMGAPFGGEVRAVDTADEALALLPGLLSDGDTVLVKASRGVGLEVVAQGLGA
jgi:UDP-N-acetylmuramoyl-tripeptide--D-alanyl-D-alanine ligase